MFASAVVIFLQSPENDTLSNCQENHQNSQKHSGKFIKLIEGLKCINYTVQIHYLQDHAQLENDLTELLKLHDIVVTIGKLSENLSKTVEKVYDEHWSDDCQSCQDQSREINQNTESSEYKHFQVIEEQQNQILKLHRFYFIDLECINQDFSQFLRLLERYTRRTVYSKAFTFNKSDEKVRDYVEQLVSRENGIRTRRLNENEVVVSSGNIEEINTINQHFLENYDVEGTYVLEEYEEEILNSPCQFIQEAIKYIKECFDIYQPGNVFISFNGGKDCTALLHLMMLILRKFYPSFKQPVFCMYVKSTKPFPQVTSFIEKLKTYYNLDMHTLTSGIKDGLAAILQEKPNLKACLMGTRRTDPFSADLRHFQATDSGWPEIMRVSPILDWEFAHVWDYLLSFKVPYCNLYDEGYTSLGNVDNTLKNPQLLNEDSGEYFPAYRLLKSTKERSGRM